MFEQNAYNAEKFKKLLTQPKCQFVYRKYGCQESPVVPRGLSEDKRSRDAWAEHICLATERNKAAAMAHPAEAV